ncbi:uncharacterized protein DMAD_06985 [Drosophila madeirensis]|uniref:Uncharacterized protein n=1 Tax=Drosophila madeirensis TaxID=30013 RepID=A0AAU9FSD1_DROMD
MMRMRSASGKTCGHGKRRLHQASTSPIDIYPPAFARIKAASTCAHAQQITRNGDYSYSLDLNLDLDLDLNFKQELEMELQLKPGRHANMPHYFVY